MEVYARGERNEFCFNAEPKSYLDTKLHKKEGCIHCPKAITCISCPQSILRGRKIALYG